MSNITDMRTMSDQIGDMIDSFKKMLVTKNIRYGNSALKPIHIFYKGDGEGQHNIESRLDEKLARIMNNDRVLRKNDVADLIGYLFLLCKREGWTNFEDMID
jgi:hypothetical protein